MIDVVAVKESADRVMSIVGGTSLSGRVNNAGVAVTGPMMHTSIDEFRYQLEITTIDPIIVVQAFLPLLGAVSLSMQLT